MTDEASPVAPPPVAAVEAPSAPRRRWHSNILIPLTALAVAGAIVVLFATQWDATVLTFRLHTAKNHARAVRPVETQAAKGLVDPANPGEKREDRS